MTDEKKRVPSHLITRDQAIEELVGKRVLVRDLGYDAETSAALILQTDGGERYTFFIDHFRGREPMIFKREVPDEQPRPE